MAKKKQQSKKKNTIQADLPVLRDGEVAYLSNVGGNYIVSEIVKNEEKSKLDNYVEQAEFDVRRTQNLYSKLLYNETNSYMTTQQELSNLAKNTQTDISKIKKINGLVRYNINKDSIIGKVIEVIENNINTRYTINYPTIKGLSKTDKKREVKMLEEFKKDIMMFNSQINIEDLIINCIISTYTEGNFVFYLKGNKENGYGVVKYPLGFVEITDRCIDGEPLIVFNIQDLKTELRSSIDRYGKMKAKQVIDNANGIDMEIKRDYPEEVYNGYIANDKFTYLNPARIGVTRINNLGQPYGVTPIFKSLSSLLTLETIEESDRTNIKARAKKIFYQKMRKECIDGNPDNINFNAVGYSHSSLLASMSNDVVIYTSTPLVESLEILEPKNETTNPETVLNNRNKVLDALGIGFATNTSKNGANTIKINYEDLLKTINKIAKQLEKILNKMYRTFTIESDYPVEYSPSIVIQDTKLLDIESQSKLVDLLYSKIGVSYKTALEIIGVDYDEEISRRTYENENGFDEDIFVPHVTSYVMSGGGDKPSVNTDKNKNGSKKSENVDKSLEDKSRVENMVK